MNLLTEINANGANAQPGLCWFVFGFQANGSSTTTTPITIQVNGVIQTLNFGDKIGINDNPDVVFLDCEGIYFFVYGCDAPIPPFEPCPCPNGECGGMIGYQFDANGCCGGGCDCVATLTYDSVDCELTGDYSGSCALPPTFSLEYSSTGSAPWTPVAVGQGLPQTWDISGLGTGNGFYRLVVDGDGSCPDGVSSIVSVNCVSTPSCDCDATLVLNGCDLDIDIFGVDCPGRPWQLQFSTSGTGWSTVLSGTGTTSQSYTPTQNGFYRLLVTDPSQTCTPIQTSNVQVSCVGPSVCNFNGVRSDGSNSGYNETFVGLNVGQELEWKFSTGNAPQGATVPDVLRIRIDGVLVVDTGAVTRVSSCADLQGCGGPVVYLADLSPPGAGGNFAVPIPVGSANVNIDSFINTCPDTGNANTAILTETITVQGFNYLVVAYGSIVITPALANKPIEIEVISNPCDLPDNLWALTLDCV